MIIFARRKAPGDQLPSAVGDKSSLGFHIEPFRHWSMVAAIRSRRTRQMTERMANDEWHLRIGPWLHVQLFCFSMRTVDSQYTRTMAQRTAHSVCVEVDAEVNGAI